MPSTHEIFAAMNERVQSDPSRLAGQTASYQFDLTGDDGGTFHLDIQNGSAAVAEGALANPGCTITLAAADFKDLVAGKANPMNLFFGGKLKIAGDMGLAMKLQSLF